jgi:hypothetical protein
MRYLLLEPTATGTTLTVHDAPRLGIAELQALVGGYFEVALMYDGATPTRGIGLHCNEEGRLERLPPTAFVPELLQVVVGPIALIAYDIDTGALSGLLTPEVEAFTLVTVDGTPVPRLRYQRPSRGSSGAR